MITPDEARRDLMRAIRTGDRDLITHASRVWQTTILDSCSPRRTGAVA